MDIASEFWDAVQNAYEKDPKAWEEERQAVQRILPAILQAIPRYTLREPYYVRRGGAGLVVRLHDTNLESDVILKMARPVAGREALLSQIIASEIARLREASHPNVISIFYHDAVEDNGQRWPYYLMEYVNDAVDAWEYVSANLPEKEALVDLVRQMTLGVEHLHARNLIHGDVKLENFLVAPSGHVKVSDLGSARKLGEETTLTTLTITPPWAHPDLVIGAYKTSHADPDRLRRDIPRAELRKEFDIYALGKNVQRVVALYDPGDKRLPAYTRAYLELAAARMLDGLNDEAKGECALGIPATCFREIKHKTIHQVARDIEKITGEYAIHNVIEELDHHFPTMIQVSTSPPPAFTGRVAKILKTEPIRRLANVTQLGIISDVYPTARHSRLEHLLGTFSNVCRFVDALWNDPINPLFKQIVSEEDIRALLVAALCHDVGYYPSAHDFEEASDIFAHTPLTYAALDPKRAEAQQLVETIRDGWGTTADRVTRILSVDPADTAAPLVDRILHTIIDGPIDADKIDYLVRDSVNLRVPYGLGIDVDRLLRCLTVTFRPEANRTFATVGIHEKGRVPAESVAFARYGLFGTVYWHHTVRAMKSMLHRAIWEAMPASNGKIDKRSTAYARFYQRFLRVAFAEDAPVVSQTSLELEEEPDEAQTSDRSPAGPWQPTVFAPDIHSADLRMIRFVHANTSRQGKALLQMLCDRTLFKRLLVVSHKRDPASKLWDDLVDFARKATPSAMIALQQRVQARLVELLLGLRPARHTAPGRTISALAPEALDLCEAMAKRQDILFLVDIPRSRDASRVGLCYVPEHRLGRPFVAASEKVGLSYSTVWGSLSDSFLQSVGKIRVFVHPDISATAEAGLPRRLVEDVLTSVVRMLG